jgi:hypothetical protein
LIRQGWLMSLFQASQQWSTIAPAGLIDQQHGVRSRRDLGGDFGQLAPCRPFTASL